MTASAVTRPRPRPLAATQLPVVLGLAGAAALVGLYLGIVTAGQSLGHALDLLAQDWYFVAGIAGGFGLQVGLFAYLRRLHQASRPTTAAAAVGTGTSTVGMVACCAHHATDVLPLLGASGAAIFLNDYRVAFMAGGLAVNAVAAAWMLRRVLEARRRVIACQS